MAPGTATTPSPCEDRTLILPIGQEEYEKIVPYPQQFRAWIDKHYRWNTELFPETFEKGYKRHDKKTAEKSGVMAWQIKLPLWAGRVFPGRASVHAQGNVHG